MFFSYLYAQLLKNKKNYNIVFSSFKIQLLFNLCVYYANAFNLNNFFFFKVLKSFLIENGFKRLLFENWYKFGLKYNIISNLLI